MFVIVCSLFQQIRLLIQLQCTLSYIDSAFCGLGRLTGILAGLLCYGPVSALHTLLSPYAEQGVLKAGSKKEQQQQKGLMSRKSVNPLSSAASCGYWLIFKC